MPRGAAVIWTRPFRMLKIAQEVGRPCANVLRGDERGARGSDAVNSGSSRHTPTTRMSAITKLGIKDET
jgi:hypothetical protein